jgi:multiple sugar transport system permease protein
MTASASAGRQPRPVVSTSALYRPMRRFTAVASVTLPAIIIVSAFLMPLAYMASTAFKERSQLTAPGAPLWPAVPATIMYEGEELPLYEVPTADGIQQWGLLLPHRQDALFIDPAHPELGPITWEGRWRTLTQVWRFELRLENFAAAWRILDFGRLFFNSFTIAILGTIGTLISSICVAYGFSRFRFPGRNALFLLVLSTIILPFQVTLIPTYAVFSALGWVGTWLPLIVPHFFANAYNVFLLRQYFVTIPRDLDEAAMIDGAGPFRILWSVIVPQAKAALVAVGLFHFFWSWNDYFLPLIYLGAKPELQPLSVGLGRLQSLYSQETTLIQAGALMALALPVIVFFLAQRAFMRGVVFSGVEK